jgi:membrane associated rhomboid family serine protease
MARVGAGSSPISIPPFQGATSRLLVYNIVCFFGLAVLMFVSAPIAGFIVRTFGFSPQDLMHGQIWQLASFSFLNFGFVNTIFGMMSLWYAGNFLESSFGARWLYQAYFASLAGGALIATPIAYTHVFGLDERLHSTGCWAGIFGLLVAIGYHFGEMEMNVMFVLRMKAKVMVALYVLIFSAELLTTGQRFEALLQLSGGLAGFLFCRFAPKRGFGTLFSEPLYGLRNSYYRWKRRRAAKKFEVYMRKQNRDVRFDGNGRYIEPDDRDPNDKRWMN